MKHIFQALLSAVFKIAYYTTQSISLVSVLPRVCIQWKLIMCNAKICYILYNKTTLCGAYVQQCNLLDLNEPEITSAQLKHNVFFLTD